MQYKRVILALVTASGLIIAMYQFILSNKIAYKAVKLKDIHETSNDSHQISEGTGSAKPNMDGSVYPDRHRATATNRTAQHRKETEPASEHLILLWAHIPRYVRKIPHLPICGGGCDVTIDRSRFDEATAVVFQMKTADMKDLPDPSKRRNDQVFVWFTRESAWTSKNFYRKSLTEFDGYFNWTMTHRRDSDVKAYMIPFMARLFVDNLYRKNTMNPHQSSDDFNTFKETIESQDCPPNDITFKIITDIVFKKKKFAAWAANDCSLTSGASLRYTIVKDLLAKGLNLEVYGKCGGKPSGMPVEQFYDTLSPHKFYLAFENGYHCLEYLTEKLWYNSFYLGIVPVVWGPTRDDVERLAPPHSFIHYDDFSSPAKLINYLQYLDRNNTAYMEYFNWRVNDRCAYPLYKVNDKDYFDISTLGYNAFVSGFCHLCKMIRSGIHLKTTKSISSLSDYWYGPENSDCLANANEIHVLT